MILFFSFLTVRVDQTVKWNWFIVFIPLYLLQLSFIIDSIILIANNIIKSKPEQSIKISIFLASIILFFIFEVLLCLKLEYYPVEIKLSFVCMPLWLVLTAASVYIFKKLIK